MRGGSLLEDFLVETISFIDGAMTIALLVVHLADYFMSWPQRSFAVFQPHAPIDGPHGIARRPLPEPFPYDRAA